MSYDINFWRSELPLNLLPEEIYRKLCEGEPVAGLDKLPVELILKRLKDVFPALDPAQKFPMIQTSEGSIEFSWSDQHFRFDIRGGICGDCQKLVDVMREFGCPMYDPQENKRYDTQPGSAVRDVAKSIPSSSTRRLARRLRITAAVVLLLGIFGADLIYWLGTRSVESASPLPLPGEDKAQTQRSEALFGKAPIMLEEWGRDLKRPGTQAGIIVVTAALVAGSCFYVARLLDHARRRDDKTGLPQS